MMRSSLGAVSKVGSSIGLWADFLGVADWMDQKEWVGVVFGHVHCMVLLFPRRRFASEPLT
jgi:hypothetical protein